MKKKVVLPNVMLVGAQKSGTTSLFRLLARHPDVYAPDVAKDYTFFIRDDLYEKGLVFYSQLFKGKSEQKIILGGNVNIMRFESALKRVCDANENMKLIIILRNPVERAISHYRFMRQKGLENRDLVEALKEEMNTPETKKTFYEKANFDYIGHGLYAKQLEMIYKYFKSTQVFVCLFDELINDFDGLKKEVFRFLDIFESKTIELVEKNKTLGSYRFKFINSILYNEKLRANFLGRLIKRLLPVTVRYKLASLLGEFNKAPGKEIVITEEAKGILLKTFSEDICKLEVILGKDLSMWQRC